MEREPTLFSIVLTHMRQLGAVVRAYESDILITQGLFIGNWGEMHGSKIRNTSGNSMLHGGRQLDPTSESHSENRLFAVWQ